ncbi:hypothetical protein VDGL01_11079 [Verticillium dahliae]
MEAIGWLAEPRLGFPTTRRRSAFVTQADA